MKFIDTIISGATEATNKIMFEAKLHSPELLLVSGIVATIAAVVSSAIAGRNIDTIMEDHNERVATAKEEDPDANLVKVYGKTAFNLAKNFAVPAVLTGASVGCTVTGHNIQAGRLNAATATIAGLREYINQYEKRNIERNGLDEHLKCKYGATTIKEQDEDGYINEKEVPDFSKSNDVGFHKYIYDETTSDNYKGWAEADRMTLESIEGQISRALYSRTYKTPNGIKPGYVSVNEVKSWLHLTNTGSNQNFANALLDWNEFADGWVYGVKGQCRNIISKEGNDKFFAGWNNQPSNLEFKVDGCIPYILEHYDEYTCEVSK
jgi:hypothetical protein